MQVFLKDLTISPFPQHQPGTERDRLCCIDKELNFKIKVEITETATNYNYTYADRKAIRVDVG